MKRRITFPHMGTSHIAIRGMLESIGLEVVTPPPITRHTLSLGTQHSPEFACLPLKINLGNFIEAYELGANTVVMSGGWGPCRFGYYAQVQREILNDLGFPMEMIVLEAPDSRISGILNQVKDLAEGTSWIGIIGAVKFGWEKVRALDEVERLAQEYRPRVNDQGAVERLYQGSLKEIDGARSRKEVRDAVAAAKESFVRLDPDWGKEVIRVGIIGEIYTVLEPFVNLNIERHLGKMGAETTRSIYLSQWVNDHLFLGLMPGKGTKELIQNAHPYLNYWVGGHGRETIGAAVYLSQLGYDGVIQLGPLTCMPEIVAQSILPLVSAREDIPAMTLYFDEHTGEAGLLTRIEAFLELIKRKKTNRKNRKQLREAK